MIVNALNFTLLSLLLQIKNFAAIFHLSVLNARLSTVAPFIAAVAQLQCHNVESVLQCQRQVLATAQDLTGGDALLRGVHGQHLATVQLPQPDGQVATFLIAREQHFPGGIQLEQRHRGVVAG